MAVNLMTGMDKCFFKKKQIDFLYFKRHNKTINTMNSEANACNCTSDRYSIDCPQTFMQGDKLLHMVHGNNSTKPQVFISPQGSSSSVNSDNEPRDGQTKPTEGPALPADRMGMMTDCMRFTALSGDETPHNHTANQYNDQIITQWEGAMPKALNTTQVIQTRLGRGRFEDDSSMKEEHRRGLRKFESLQVGENTLTSMSIGGYAVNLPRAAQKAMEVAPLPPARLPIIFKEDDLNFHHHFFQGLEILIGREVLLEIVLSKKYYDQTEMILLPLIERMIQSGYERTDTEVTVFTKRVLMSTFDLGEQEFNSNQIGGLTVAANLWGFQYIESGMQCKESDLKMWLSICYNHYRTIWFNTFKSAGVPHFALEGVQLRYENPLCGMERELKMSPRVMTFPESSPSESGSSRRRHKSRQQKEAAPSSSLVRRDTKRGNFFGLG